MKLIKKIAAIMFAFMMVVSMSCNVKADEGTTPTTGETGTITINNAVNEQTYTIYKLLDLESYDKTNDHYSYKPATEWKSFFETAEAKNYITVDDNGYANWVKGADQVAFAQKALSYATTNNIGNKGTAPASNNTVTFNNLDLGYYLVDSSVGALCLLDTTNPTATIQEKNGVPTVTKKIYENSTLVSDNSANIGDILSFVTTIKVGAGAKDYVLHDKMEQGLTFVPVKIPGQPEVSVHAENGTEPTSNTDFTIETNCQDGCAFHVVFKQSYLDKTTQDSVITVTYSAKLNEKAFINKPNENKTWLSYGDSKNKTESTTETYTYGIKVFKYTKNGTSQEGLKDAQFKLFTDESCTKEVNLNKDTDGVTYFVTNTETGDNIMTSPQLGKFEIKGLKAGTYYLKEIEAPKGYNKLANPIIITISQNDSKNQVITVGDDTKPVDEVGVENKTGTVLPSTGGAGTTMIYLVGAVLVLGSGVVLATKRRMKNK